MEEIEDIRQLACAVDGVIDVHDIAIHSYGKDKFASIHIEIDADEKPAKAHDISEKVEEALGEKLGVSPTVHVDPISITDPKVKEVKKYLWENWSNHDVITDFHDVRVVDTAQHHVILFGVNVKPSVSKSRVIESCNEVEKVLKSVFNKLEKTKYKFDVLKAINSSKNNSKAISKLLYKPKTIEEHPTMDVMILNPSCSINPKDSPPIKRPTIATTPKISRIQPTIFRTFSGIIPRI